MPWRVTVVVARADRVRPRLTLRSLLLQVDRDELVVFILRKAHDASDADYAEGMKHLKQFALSMKRQEVQGSGTEV